MKFIEFSMHQENSRIIQLTDLLAAIPNNDWSWSILDFYGVGKLLIGMSMEKFEETARSMPGGYLFSWSELKAFAGQIEQTWDCLIVAAESKQNLIAADLEKDNFSRCLLVLQAMDTTTWSVGAREEQLFKNINKNFSSNFYTCGGRTNSAKNILQRGPARPL